MTALETALELLSEGLWPVPITAPDDPRAIAPGKQPIGERWGVKRHTKASLREVYAKHPGAGVGLRLGPAGGVIDIDVDEPEKAEATLLRIFDGEVPETRGWSSARGFHWLFAWDDRLARYGKAIIKGHPAYQGVEIRLGWSDRDQQYQSVVPPSVGTNGEPREWNGHAEILPLPECFFDDLDENLTAPPPAAASAGTRPVREARSVLMWSIEQRAVAYLKRCEPAVSGQRGHDKAFKAACKVGPGFDLPPDVAFRLLLSVYNPTCQPPWSEKELRHKVEDAYRAETRRGWFLEEDEPETAGGGEAGEAPAVALVHPDDPHRLAEVILRDHLDRDGFPTLVFWLEDWHKWDGSRYTVLPAAEVRAEVVNAVKTELDRVAEELSKPPIRVTSGLITNVVQALAGLCLLKHKDCPNRPAWLEARGEDLPAPHEVIAARNGLIHLPAFVEGRSGILPPTPRFFSPNCLDYSFDPHAPRPDHWLEFLESIWGDDPASVEALQEWFGYLLTPDTSQQKMLFLIGPPRSGKGTIARTLTSLVGSANVAFPTLTSLANEFRVAPLIGRTLAIFPDARLNGRIDVPAIVERLLSISGEDAQTIDRKNKESWDGKLRTRFVLMANELPQLSDASGAVTSRTVILRLTRSFEGQEDRTLQGKLEAELPSILLWSIAGWARLRHRGYLVQPDSGQMLLKELHEITSPISSFLSERCELVPESEVSVDELYKEWKTWCEENGRDRPGQKSLLGRYLRAAVPSLETFQKRVDGKHARFFRGVRLLPAPLF